MSEEILHNPDQSLVRIANSLEKIAKIGGSFSLPEFQTELHSQETTDKLLAISVQIGSHANLLEKVLNQELEMNDFDKAKFYRHLVEQLHSLAKEGIGFANNSTESKKLVNNALRDILKGV